ncbi:MAG: sugar phosphate nucleotidyltransferase, partial [Anaerolineae bacterium]
MTLQGVILAAGKGSRLHPITTRRSKAMLPILGQPIVERVMEGLWDNGVDTFILVVSPDDADIVGYFTQESPLADHVTFVEQRERLGMAHALQQAAPHIQGPFVLSACDNLVPRDHIAELISSHHADPSRQATLSLMHVPPALIGRTGIVALDGGWVTRIVEKPELHQAPSDVASLPLYVFKPRILDYLHDVPLSPRGEYELQDAIQMLID